jgi:hypothetical protein
MLIAIGVMLLISTFIQNQLVSSCACPSSSTTTSSTQQQQQQQHRDNLASLIALSRENDWPYQFDQHVQLPGRVAELQAKLLRTCHGRLRELEDERKALLRRMTKMAQQLGDTEPLPTIKPPKEKPAAAAAEDEEEQDQEESST